MTEFKAGDKVRVKRLLTSGEVGYIRLIYNIVDNIPSIKDIKLYLVDIDGEFKFFEARGLELIKMEPEEKEPELLPIGTRVKIISNDSTDFLKSGDEGIIIERTKNVYPLYSIQLDCGKIGWKTSDNIQKLEDSLPKWQPKFKVGDWVVTPKNTIGIITKSNIYSDGASHEVEWLSASGFMTSKYFGDDDLTIWQPIKELQDETELLSKIRYAQAKSIEKLRKEIEELKLTNRSLEIINGSLKIKSECDDAKIESQVKRIQELTGCPDFCKGYR
jgi:hypothetical protein